MGKSSSADEKILSYNDVVLRRSDLDILSGPQYLNDRIIEFYFSYLSTTYPSPEILLVPPSIAFWISNCPDTDSLKGFLAPLKFPEKKLAIFPINDNGDVSIAEGGTHWSLLVYFRNSDVFVHHDSNGGMNKRCAKQLYKIVGKFMSDMDNELTSKYIECGITPQQVNGYDCGVYVMAIARVICEWYQSSVTNNGESLWFSGVKEKVTAASVTRMRKEVLELIREGMAEK